VDDDSTDGTVEIAKQYTMRVFPRKHAERSVQRNFGASKAKGDHILFLDADIELSAEVIKECVQACSKNKDVGAVAIPEESVATNYWERVKAFERSFYNEAGDTTTDAARFFTKEAFNAVNGYDETITGPEDWDLPERVQDKGYKMARAQSPIYHYERVKSLFSLAKKKFYYALTSHRYLKKHEISPVSAKTIYFLRPVFYKNWRKVVSNPLLSLGMFIMFSLELIAGGSGFLIGKIRNL
jgi:glycosyltransferase involved in cell wall biosynthesis